VNLFRSGKETHEILQNLTLALEALTAEVRSLRGDIRRLQQERTTAAQPAQARPEQPRASQARPRTQARQPAKRTAKGAQAGAARTRARTGQRRSRKAPVPVTVTGVSKPAADYLTDRGYVIEAYQDTIDEQVTETCRFLGRRHSTSLAPLFNQLSRSKAEEPLVVDLGARTAKEYSHSVNLCQMLKRTKYLGKFEQHDETQRLRVTLTKDGVRFLKGYWLEQFVGSRLDEFLHDSNARYSILMNAKIANEGNKHELDLFVLEEDEPLWIECTTAKNTLDRRKKMHQIRRRLNVVPERTILVASAASDSQVRNIAKTSPFQFTNLASFIPTLEKATRYDPQ
jgi:hypothetical protein